MTTTQDRAGALGERVALQFEIEQFLYREAELLDDRRFRDWLDLLDDDIEYGIPNRHNVAGGDAGELAGPEEMAWMHDTKRILEWRVNRFGTGMAWSEQVPSRTRHLVSNVRVTPTDDADRYEVRSSFLVYRNQGTRETIYAGYRDDVLRRAGESWTICRRRITLDQATLAGNLSIFL